MQLSTAPLLLFLMMSQGCAHFCRIFDTLGHKTEVIQEPTEYFVRHLR